MTKPFLKWVGGKNQLLPELLCRIPSYYKNYYEPFLGGGALYFALQPQKAFLSDINNRLINTYQCVKSNVDEVIIHMNSLTRSSDCYYEQRKLLNEDNKNDLKAASRFIFINKTCYNGLWRENKKSMFNVPYGGDKSNKFLADEDRLRQCSKILQSATLNCCNFSSIEDFVQSGDFVYFDPPYVPIKLESFTEYSADGFGIKEQIKLRDMIDNLKRKGVYILLSNSNSPIVHELYKDFSITEIDARRSINSDKFGRGKVKELVIQ